MGSRRFTLSTSGPSTIVRRSGSVSSRRVSPAGAFGAVRVRHREYVQDITGIADTAFHLEAFGINPGDAGTFPWLANLASQFEEYRFNHLKFIYNTVSSDTYTGGNTNLGTIIMCTQYNSLNPPFLNKSFMENYEGAISGKPSLNLTHGVDVRHNMTPYQLQYIRTAHFTISPQFGNLLQYDVGQFYLGFQSCAPNQLGELWVDYDVTLMKPRLSMTTSLRAPLQDVYNLAPLNLGLIAGYLWQTTPAFGASTFTIGQQTLGTRLFNTFAVAGSSSILFPKEDLPGTVYQVVIWLGGTANAALTARVGTPTVSANGRIIFNYNSPIINNVASAVGLFLVERQSSIGDFTMAFNTANPADPVWPSNPIIQAWMKVTYAPPADILPGSGWNINGALNASTLTF